MLKRLNGSYVNNDRSIFCFIVIFGIDLLKYVGVCYFVVY